MSRRLATLTLLCAAILDCKSFGAAPRRGTEGTCNSDRDCLYGLVCRGAPAREAGERRCVYERYSRCTDTLQCLAGRTCRGGYCETQCVVDTDCSVASMSSAAPDAGATHLRCVVGECKADETGRSCLVPADCAASEECVAGRCEEAMEQRCLSDADCSTGSRCVSGRCQ